MRFKQYLELMEAEEALRFNESGFASSLGRGVLAGTLALAPLLSASGSPKASDPSAPQAQDYVPPDKELDERMKDEGRYYSGDTTRRLIKAAEEGDEWAVRELPWPKGHKFHEKGRPFFRNDAPHPQGLFDPTKPPAPLAPNKQRIEKMKDDNLYWNADSFQKLVKAAEEGDEWAVREIRWPKAHPLYKKGRPFFRNDKPHPDGLFPNSGY